MYKNVRKNRMNGIDLFRIFAVFIVFLFHSNIHLGCTYWIITPFITMGAMFMTAFFMISGFALFHVYRDTDFSNIRNLRVFYIKRFIGLIPVYYIVCILYDIYINAPITQVLQFSPLDILGIQSWLDGTFSYLHVSGTWFISCIILSYFAFPLITIIVTQIKTKERIILYIIFSCTLLYIPLAIYFFKLNSQYTNPLLRLLEFTLGILLESILSEEKIIQMFYIKVLRKWYVFIFEIIILIVEVVTFYNIGISRGNYLLYNWIGIPIYTLMFITLSDETISNSLNNSKVLSFAISISYTYFFAQFFTWRTTLKIIEIIRFDGNLIRLMISIILCTIIATLLHLLFEKPAKKFLSKVLLID